MFGHDANLADTRKVVVVEIAAARDDEIANLLEVGRHADEHHGPGLPRRHDGQRKIVCARRAHGLGDFLAHGVQVG